MKKILVITPFFYPHIGGSERYIEELYLFLREKHPEIAVDVLCYNTNQASSKENYQGMTIYRIPCLNILKDQFSLPNPLALIQFLLVNRNSYDLIHCSTRFFDSSWWAPFYAKLTKTCVVLTDHCASYPTTENLFTNVIVKLIENTIVRFSLHFYDAIFAETKATKHFLKQTFGINSEVAYPGLSSNLQQPRAESKKVTVIYVGRMIKSKGVVFLFDIAKENTAINFVFAGPGELVKALKERAEKEKLPNIEILDGISKTEVSILLGKADIFAYPSWHSEGLPMALVEAGEKGMAVIATNTGAINELIVDRQTGILVAPRGNQEFKAGLQQLITDRNLRLKLGKSLQEFTQNNFTWEKAASLVLEQLY
jgi:glycosyltransferase involved in cell wall biosynthesis